MGATGFDTSRYHDTADDVAVPLAALATLAAPDLAAQIMQLRLMPCPRFMRRDEWPRHVNDAVWLHESGRAQMALEAGWILQELFGWSETTWRSMAGWLNGSRSLVVGESFDGPVHTKWACKRSGGERLFFIRNMAAKPPDDVVMLWDLSNHR